MGPCTYHFSEFPGATDSELGAVISQPGKLWCCHGFSREKHFWLVHFELAPINPSSTSPQMSMQMLSSLLLPISVCSRQWGTSGDNMWCFNFSENQNTCLPHPFIFWRYARTREDWNLRTHHRLRGERQADFTLLLKTVVFLLNSSNGHERLCVLRQLLVHCKEALCKVMPDGNDLH